MLVLKKKGRTVDRFFPGNQLSFSTGTAYYDGVISTIARDTIFLIRYDIRQMPTTLGVYYIDTVATYHNAIYYKDILALNKSQDKNFNWSGSGGALLGGGTLLTAFGLGTWLFAKPNTRYYASPYLVGGAAVLGATGYFLMRAGAGGIVIGKKYSLEYIDVK
ncbi:MAG: hypothetical protein ABIO82_03180 [Ginsengibacter sp.]